MKVMHIELCNQEQFSEFIIIFLVGGATDIITTPNKEQQTPLFSLILASAYFQRGQI